MQEGIAVDAEALTAQGRARRVGKGGAGAVQLTADVRSRQPHRTQVTSALGGETGAQEHVVGDLEALTVQGWADGVGDSGTRAVQLAPDVRPNQPYRSI